MFNMCTQLHSASVSAGPSAFLTPSQEHGVLEPGGWGVYRVGSAEEDKRKD